MRDGARYLDAIGGFASPVLERLTDNGHPAWLYAVPLAPLHPWKTLPSEPKPDPSVPEVNSNHQMDTLVS